MTDIAAGWRIVDGGASAWFDAPSLIEGAALAARIIELSAGAAIDLRSTGVRVRLDSDDHAGAVSVAARELGLTADPAALQSVGVVFESTDPAAVLPFWQRVLGDTPDVDGAWADPLRRDPTLRFRQSAELRPLRHRVHLDVVRPGAVIEMTGLGAGSGPYDVRHADPDGNEVDLVPGDPLGDTSATDDWQVVFGAMAIYRTTSPTQQVELTAAAAAMAAEAGFPLLIDLRPGLVILDSGKDQWDRDAHGLDVDFVDLADSIQVAARRLGAMAESGSARFVQLFLDAADVATVTEFWIAALGYVHDRREGITDVHDPRRLNPTLVFQELDASETERRAQRNRIHFELAVPSDLAGARVAATLAAGGRLLDESPGRWQIADPEGNELMIVAGG